MKRLLMMVLLLSLLAVFACSVSSEDADDDDDDNDAKAADDDDDTTPTDDDDDDDDASDDDDDDATPSCGLVWVECEYENVWWEYDATFEACGEEPPTGGAAYYAFKACALALKADHYYALEQCGRARGCDDWKADYYQCYGDFYQADAECCETATSPEEWQECAPDTEDYWCRTAS